MLREEERDALVYTPHCRQRWGARQPDGATPLLAAEDVEEFLTEFAWMKESELALQCLFDSEFNVPKAVALLHTLRRERLAKQREFDERLTSDAFEAAVKTHGKRFHLVQQALGKQVITREVVSQYYLWKRTTEYSEWRDRQKNKKKRKGKRELSRLHWGDEADSEKESIPDYHNERCELCSTGGRLLCCDGCARAYHFACVSISGVPNRDWYCVYCQKVMGGIRPKLIPSDENSHCMSCAPFPEASNFSSLAECVLNASSYAESDESSKDRSDDDDSDYPSTEELSPDIDNVDPEARVGNPHGSDKISSASMMDVTSSPALKKQHGVNGPLLNQSPHLPSHHVPGLPSTAPSPPVAMPMQLPTSGRKRHRKTIAPRRIPQPNDG